MGYVAMEMWFSFWCWCEIPVQLKQFRKALSCVQHNLFSPWCSDWGVRLITHLRLMPRLRMCGIKELYLHPRQTAARMLSWHAQGLMCHVTFICKLLTIQSFVSLYIIPIIPVPVLLICRWHVAQFEFTDITEASNMCRRFC